MDNALPGLPPPRPIPISERASVVFLERGQIDVLDGAFVLIDAEGVRTHVPVGGYAALMLEPGTRISHRAVGLAAKAGTLLVWCGEAGVRLYSAGQPGGARADRLLWQAQLALDEAARLRVVRKMYQLRFKEDAPARRSVDQLRGLEGARVREMYRALAGMHGVHWTRRHYDPASLSAGDLANQCLSAATACLYGVCEAAILAAGYAPAIGFLHTGKPQSFVYDIADIVKFETVVPAAFQVAGRIQRTARGQGDPDPRTPESQVRHACRDAFRQSRILGRLVPLIEEVLEAGELPRPEPPPEAQPVAFEDSE